MPVTPTSRSSLQHHHNGRHYANAPFYADDGLRVRRIGSGQYRIAYRPAAPHGRWVEVRALRVVPRVARTGAPTQRPLGLHGALWLDVGVERALRGPLITMGAGPIPRRSGGSAGYPLAPVWVAWRGSNDHLVWAPLPPDPQDSFGIGLNISIGNTPNYYWQAVPSQNFLDTNLANVIIGDNNQVTNIVNRTVIGSVNVVNVVVNKRINIECR